jgi:tellurite resistance protein
VVGGALTGQWVTGEMNQDALHPGHFLPTVAGGFIGGYAAAVVHLHAVAEASFGLGLVSWLLLGSTVLNRLFLRPALPPALVPTLSIELAAPAVAGFAWFAITGGSTGLMSRLLAGYAVLMALVQLWLVPAYARLRFSVSFWSFTFCYAAAAVDALLWLRFTHPAGARTWGTIVLVLITAFIAAIAARTVVAIARGQFLAQPPERLPGKPA